MKILFAYFGQPRYVYENMPNHIALMKQIKNSLVSYDGVHIDILFSTTPIENTIVEKIESIAPSDMNVKFDFISELARADIASSIHSKLKSNYFHKHDVITICHQIISIHMLASKIDKEYDAVYVLRTDMLFATYKTQFDFSFLGHFIGKSDLDYKIFVTDMKQVVSERKQSMDVNDQIFLTSKSTLRDLYFDDFQENFDEIKNRKREKMEDTPIIDIHNNYYYLPTNVTLIKGDVTKTLPDFLQNNRHVIVSLLYLDMDIYEPTKVALKELLPRMAKGSIIAFDELNWKSFPGETIAVLEELGTKYKFKNLLNSQINYCIIE